MRYMMVISKGDTDMTYSPAEALMGKSIEALQSDYDAFIAATGLPAMSADELQYEIGGTCRPAEFKWLGAFVAAWHHADQ